MYTANLMLESQSLTQCSVYIVHLLYTVQYMYSVQSTAMGVGGCVSHAGTLSSNRTEYCKLKIQWRHLFFFLSHNTKSLLVMINPVLVQDLPGGKTSSQQKHSNSVSTEGRFKDWIFIIINLWKNKFTHLWQTADAPVYCRKLTDLKGTRIWH
jgi:hypothetical protein